MAKFSFLKDRNTVLVGIAVIAIVVVGVLIFADSKGFSFNLLGASDDQIAKKAVDYINNNQLSSTPASFVKASDASGLVKITLKIGSSQFDSYATKDGKLLFPQAFDMTQSKSSASASVTPAPTPGPVSKADSPMLEAYVVARCPFGLQMQRAMAEAVKAVPALANYIKVRYIGEIKDGKIYSMHDVDTSSNPIPNGKEGTENLRQICIREEQPSKYWAYVGCQMKASGTENSCATSTGVDVAKLNACVSDPKKGIAYAQKDFDLNTKYDIQGSPTLVLNGGLVDETPYGGRSADGVKAMVCAGSKTPGSFCSQKLNTAEAATSFSATYADTTAAATGNSGNNGANCAPAQ